MQTNKKLKTTRLIARVSATLVLGGLLTVGTNFGGQTASAVGSTCSSITDCTNQINNANNQVNSLKDQAVSYKDAITRLGSQITQTQNVISFNQSEQVRLAKSIADAQAQIDQQKNVLGEALRQMYVDGQITQIEAFASSDNLSSFVNKQEYRNAVQDSVQSTIDKVTKLQADLQSQKEQVARIIADTQNQAAQLRNDQAAQNNMLGMNQSQQSSYNALTAANQSKLNALIAAQRSANNSSKGGYYFLRFPGAVRGFNDAAYPYANSGFSMSTAPGCNDGDGPDKWGYCTRQCVSYAAWAVEASGRTAPKFYGNAKNWVSRARANGILVSNTPQPGDVAISTSGTWGHAMYVEQVVGNKIYVAQYNQQLNGQFSHQLRQWQ